MACPFCDNPNEPSWVSCPCPGANSARLVGFKLAWQHHNGPMLVDSARNPPADLLIAQAKRAALGHHRATLAAAPETEPQQDQVQITPKASPPLPQEDRPTRDIEDCGPEASAFLMESKSAFSPRNQAILRFSEGIAASNPDLAGWVHRAAAAFLAGEPIPKRRPPKVAGKATKAARAD